MSDQSAGDGETFVCLACGRTSQTKYGDGDGWDESCMLNSRLVRVDQIKWNPTRTRVVEVK